MTDEHIKTIHRELDELKLSGTPTPRETALANTATSSSMKSGDFASWQNKLYLT